MARAKKSGRVTAKGTRPGDRPTERTDPSGRYTAPIPQEVRESPRWVPVLMFTLLGVGMLMIIANYFGVLPGETNNTYLLVGLGLITAGFVTATSWH